MSQDSDYRILLVGRTGHGKSSTGNTIFGEDVFEVSGKSKSTTKTCSWSKNSSRLGKVVEVVDTPGIFDTDLDQAAVQKELLKSLALTTPGFHVIAFVLMKGKFTEEIQKTRDLFFDWFGEYVEKFACVILTDTDNEKDKQEYIYDDPHPKLAELVHMCDNNVIALNNKGSNESKDMQVRKLFEVIDDIKRRNDNMHFSNVFFNFVESYLHSRNPLNLTNESIRIIENAAEKHQLSQSQMHFLKQMCSGPVSAGDNSAVTSESSTESVNSDLAKVIEESDSGNMGNLQIYDSISNEKISNTQRNIATIRQQDIQAGSDEVARSEPESCNKADEDSFEVPGKQNILQNPVNTNQHSIYQIDCSDASSVMQGSATGTDDNQCHQPEQKRSGKRNRRHNRVVDLESVRYDTPVQVRDEFKGRINDGDNGEEELRGLSGYIQKAWRYCKRKVGCILL